MSCRSAIQVLLILLLPIIAFGCGGGSGTREEVEPFVGILPDDTQSDPAPPPAPPPPPPAPAPVPPGSTTSAPRVPRASTPPIGLTWHVGYTENATKARLEAIYAQVVSLNSALWNLSEGQVYIYKVVISDNAGPGTSPTGWQADSSVVPSSNLDIVVWPSAAWDLTGTLGVVWYSSPSTWGRTGLLMLLPSNANTHTWLHEAGHFIWDLSWPGEFGLADEYTDGIQDPACVMESTNPPRRLCSDGNHVAQLSQPHACWHQILLDYANYTHADKDSASTSPWRPKVEYNDAP